MRCEPTRSDDVEYVATPEESVPVPRDVGPSIKVTLPVGVVEPLEDATVAVNVTLDPAVIAVDEADSVVVLAFDPVKAGTGWLISDTPPARISSLPSLFISTAMAGAPAAMLIRSLGMMLPLNGTEAN